MISNNFKKRFFTSILLFLLVYLIFISKFFLAYFLIVIGLLSLIEFSLIIKKFSINAINKTLFNILFITYIFIICLVFFVFSNFLLSKIFLYIVLLGCIASDIGGFCFGKIFKGPKLSKISPNKTYSGVVGSIIFTVITMSTVFFYFFSFLNLNIILVSILTTIFCQLGDLFISYLKRKANIKDTGKFLPGHGGILDRIDGIIFGLPIGYFTLLIIN